MSVQLFRLYKCYLFKILVNGNKWKVVLLERLQLNISVLNIDFSKIAILNLFYSNLYHTALFLNIFVLTCTPSQITDIFINIQINHYLYVWSGFTWLRFSDFHQDYLFPKNLSAEFSLNPLINFHTHTQESVSLASLVLPIRTYFL